MCPLLLFKSLDFQTSRCWQDPVRSSRRQRDPGPHTPRAAEKGSGDLTGAGTGGQGPGRGGGGPPEASPRWGVFGVWREAPPARLRTPKAHDLSSSSWTPEPGTGGPDRPRQRRRSGEEPDPSAQEGRPLSPTSVPQTPTDKVGGRQGSGDKAPVKFWKQRWATLSQL